MTGLQKRNLCRVEYLSSDQTQHNLQDNHATLFISTNAALPDQPLRRPAGGHYRIWYDKDSIHGGDNWQESINQASITPMLISG